MAPNTAPERQPLLRSQSSRTGAASPKGKSTLTQTILNSTNVLLGVGLLSLPLGLRYAGWIAGSLLLLTAASVTGYTAKILAACLNTDKSLTTYADLAYASYGSRACRAVAWLLGLTLTAACTALLIFFGDSMNLLVPSISISRWKIICGLILIPLQFVPFSFLSFASMIGIAASLGLVAMTVLAGVLKDEFPGSLLHPATTSLSPQSWPMLALSFGLIMSPWGGHASFPNLFRDMQNPAQYDTALVCTFTVTYAVDFSMALCGYLMYGNDTRDEIIANILVTPNHPKALLGVTIGLVAIMPVTKIPLSSRPLVTMIEDLLRLEPSTVPRGSKLRDGSGKPTTLLHVARTGLRVLVVALFVVTAIVFPKFDVIMALAGSALSITTCVILPLLFHDKLMKEHNSPLKQAANWALIVVAAIVGLAGTIAAILPPDLLSGTAIEWVNFSELERQQK